MMVLSSLYDNYYDFWVSYENSLWGSAPHAPLTSAPLSVTQAESKLSVAVVSQSYQFQNFELKFLANNEFDFQTEDSFKISESQRFDWAPICYPTNIYKNSVFENFNFFFQVQKHLSPQFFAISSQYHQTGKTEPL